MKKLTLFIASALILNSCAKDPCSDVLCLNNGTCLDGTCLCQDWYEGENCGTEERAKYYGLYTGTLTLTQNGQVIAQDVTQMDISDGASINRLQVDGLGTEAKINVSGQPNFDLVPFTIVSQGETVQCTGFGTFNGSQLSMYGQMSASGETINWTYVGTK